jgi:microcystin-dependent protein
MTPLLGEIIEFAGTFAPRGWALCQGQLLAISQNEALFSILGTIYGGDGRTTFGLPDLRGRVALSAGTGPGLTPRPLGQRSGSATNTHTINTMPSHSHTATGTIKAKNGAGDESNPGGGYPATAGTDLYAEADGVNMAANSASITVGPNGGSQPINNMAPYLATNYIIALVGIYPSRT